MESRDHTIMMLESILEITTKLNIPFIFKVSFDKANRTSIKTQRGIGLAKSIMIFEEIKKRFSIPIVTDIHKEEHCNILKDVVDILQIPAFLCRQTDLLEAAAKTGLIVNVKKGQFLSPFDVQQIVYKLEHFGCSNILLTERGSSFGYNNLVVDFRSFPIMKKTGYPVIFDATHSVQMPGGLVDQSGGDRTMIPYLARSAAACGIAGLFMEVHNDPDSAPSDGQCMVKLSNLEEILTNIVLIDKIIKNNILE
jgi:2-dehydro-3-deoxyphosphooctonate aldolase (KDO 8-P synthase)